VRERGSIKELLIHARFGLKIKKEQKIGKSRERGGGEGGKSFGGKVASTVGFVFKPPLPMRGHLLSGRLVFGWGRVGFI